MKTRRDVLRIGACVATSAAMAAAPATRARPKTILILGGTGFIGPHLTQEALRGGWKVTHFNRGKRAAGGVAGCLLKANAATFVFRSLPPSRGTEATQPPSRKRM